jgi:hypothetical protein
MAETRTGRRGTTCKHKQLRGHCPTCERCPTCDALRASEVPAGEPESPRPTAPEVVPARPTLPNTPRSAPGGCDEETFSGERSDLEVQKLEVDVRKARASAELAELKAQQMRGDLIPRVKAEHAHAVMARAVRERFRALPKRVAGEVARLTDRFEVEEVLRRHVEEALNALANVPAAEIEHAD